MEQIMQYMA
jgi:hypothetical protein